MNYNEAVAFLLDGEGEVKPGLERISKLIQDLSNPHAGMKIIHVAGTNGKGSVAAFISTVMIETGKRIGCFNSPWISKINESIFVNGEMISDQELVETVEQILPFSAGATHFEKLTALAFCHFRNKNCEYVVLEAGMGGAFDATNFIATSIVSVLTKISLDHQSFLGETLKEIAKHKAGIIKNDSQVVCATQSKEVFDEIELEATRKHAKLFVLNPSDFTIVKHTIDGSKFRFRSFSGDDLEYKIQLAGHHQVENCCLAILALHQILKTCSEYEECDDVDQLVLRGVSKTRWAGRFEVVCRMPWLILDGAHNFDGVNTLVENLKEFFPGTKSTFIFGVLKDKNVEEMAGNLSEIAGCFYAVTPDNNRALASSELAKILRKNFENVHDSDKISEALKIVMENAAHDDVIVVCGSLYLLNQINLEVCKYVL